MLVYSNLCVKRFIGLPVGNFSAFFCNRNEVSYYRDEIRSANLALISGRFRLENPASFAVACFLSSLVAATLKKGGSGRWV